MLPMFSPFTEEEAGAAAMSPIRPSTTVEAA